MDLGKAPELEFLCSSSQDYLHDNTFTKDTEIACLLNQILQVKTKDYVLTLTTTQCTVLSFPNSPSIPILLPPVALKNQKIHLATKTTFSLKKKKGLKGRKKKGQRFYYKAGEKELSNTEYSKMKIYLLLENSWYNTLIVCYDGKINSRIFAQSLEFSKSQMRMVSWKFCQLCKTGFLLLGLY